jgi:hypothetical protein
MKSKPADVSQSHLPIYTTLPMFASSKILPKLTILIDSADKTQELAQKTALAANSGAILGL